MPVISKRGPADRVLLFARSLAELRRRFTAAERVLVERGGLWICWPKKASGVASDFAEPDVRAFGLAAGWVDYKVCAVDARWSGLLFAPQGVSLVSGLWCRRLACTGAAGTAAPGG